MEWMMMNPPTLEEELHMEATLREIDSCEDVNKLRGLCQLLAKQGWHQAKLLQQAVGHIAFLEERAL